MIECMLICTLLVLMAKNVLVVHYNYRNDIQQIFDAKNSNFNDTLKSSNRTRMRLIKAGKLKIFQQQINEMLEIGTLVPLSQDEIDKLATTPHQYTRLAYTESTK